MSRGEPFWCFGLLAIQMGFLCGGPALADVHRCPAGSIVTGADA
jgi:hypothetical protein